MSYFQYAEGLTKDLKAHLLDATLDPTFAAVLSACNSMWGDDITLPVIPADRIHRAMPSRLILNATPADVPALFITPQDAAEQQPRPAGRNVWAGNYEVYLTYADTADHDDILTRMCWRYTQAIAEFFRRHSTLGGDVQALLVRGFIYGPIYFDPASLFADMTVRLEIRKQEHD